METNTRLDRIRELNDNARRLLTHRRVYVTRGIAALPVEDQAFIFSRVCSFDEFTPENDPYGEHDFGAFEHNGVHIFWKIDCYDRDDRYGSPNPADPNVTHRVLTILLADEYRPAQLIASDPPRKGWVWRDCASPPPLRYGARSTHWVVPDAGGVANEIHL